MIDVGKAGRYVPPDREETMPSTRTVLACALLTGLALGQAGCSSAPSTSATAPSSAPAPATSPATSAPAGASPTAESTEDTGDAPEKNDGGDGGGILGGDRQVVIKPAQEPEGILAVQKGRLTVTDGPAEYTLFVLVPARDGLHQIRTAKADTGGEPSCMGVQSNGSNPLTVVAAACDSSRDGQLFRIRKAQESSKEGYGISNQGAYLQISPENGLIAEELGDSPLRTVYTFVDNGAAPAGPGE